MITMGQTVKLDPVTGSLIVIDHEHHEIHEGDHFFYSDSVTLNSGLTQVYLVTTPNTTKWVHMILETSHTDVAQIDLYETSDRVGTTLQTAFNSNRNSSTAAALQIHKGVSGGTTDGVRLAGYNFGVREKSGGSVRSAEEVILKQNTKYLLRLTSGANSELFYTRMIWYEHASGE